MINQQESVRHLSPDISAHKTPGLVSVPGFTPYTVCACVFFPPSQRRPPVALDAALEARQDVYL